MLAPLSHARYGRAALLLEIHFINRIQQPFNPTQPESAKYRCTIQQQRAEISFSPRGNRFSIPRAPAAFARTIYHFSFDSGAQNTAFVIFPVLFSEDRNTRLPDRKKRTYLNGVLDKMIPWCFAHARWVTGAGSRHFAPEPSLKTGYNKYDVGRLLATSEPLYGCIIFI